MYNPEASNGPESELFSVSVEGNSHSMFAWLNGWEVILILSVVLIIFSGNLGSGSSGGGGGIGSHPLTVCDDILEWIVKAKEELWVRLGGKQK